MKWLSPLLLLLSACPSVEEIVFTSIEGPGLGSCICSYDDGSHGNAAVEVTCSPGSGKIQAASFFFRPPYLGDTEQGVEMILQVTGRGQSFPAAARGAVSPPGEVEEIGRRSIRHVDHMEITWSAQTVCDVVNGCATREEIPAGALKNGSGGCSDFWAFEK